jgi:hypothetical protein
MLQPREHNLLTRLLDFAGQKHLVEDRIDLVEVEDKIELTDVSEKGIEDLNEEVNSLEEGELVIVCVDTGAEEETGVTAVDDLIVAKLDKVGLVFLIARRNETVDFALELNLLLVAKRGVPFGQTSLAPEKSLVMAHCIRVKNLLSVLNEDKRKHLELARLKFKTSVV